MKFQSNSQTGEKSSKRNEDDGVQSEIESLSIGDSIQFKNDEPNYTWRYVNGKTVKEKKELPSKFKEFRKKQFYRLPRTKT